MIGTRFAGNFCPTMWWMAGPSCCNIGGHSGHMSCHKEKLQGLAVCFLYSPSQPHCQALRTMTSGSHNIVIILFTSLDFYYFGCFCSHYSNQILIILTTNLNSD